MDYSKFDKLAIEEEAEELENKAIAEDAKRAKELINKARQAHGIKTTEEDTDSEDSDLESCPLFWTKPPSVRKNASKKALEMEQVLQNMIYEDKSPEDLAEDFKERGNTAFRQNQPKEAMSLYTEALEWAHKAWTNDKDMSAVIATILSNRAAVLLKQKNYRSAIKEADASIKACANGSSSNKARFRGARACLDLKKPNEALSKFLVGVSESISEEQQITIREVESDDEETKKNKRKLLAEATELAALVKEAQAMKLNLIEEEKSRMKMLIQEKKEDDDWRKRFASHGIRLGPLTMDLQPFTGGSEKAGGRGPYPEINNGHWAWPCLFMYPEVSQSDYVQKFDEANTLEELLNTMFPPNAAPAPWDLYNHYTLSDLEVYFRERAAVPFDLSRPLTSQTKDLVEMEENDVMVRRWFRVPLATTLGEVLARTEYVIPGIPLFVVISKKSTRFRTIYLESCKEKDGPVVDLKVQRA